MSVVKGVAIILMVLGHAEAPSFVTNFIYLFHMPVFFMAAGYFFAERYLDQPWQFVVRRVKGLYVPFVKWSLFFLVIHNLMFALGILNEQYGNWSGGVTHPYSGRDMLQRAVHIIFSMGGYDEFLAGAFWFFRALLLASLAYLALRLLLRRMAARLGVQGLSPVTASIITCHSLHNNMCGGAWVRACENQLASARGHRGAGRNPRDMGCLLLQCRSGRTVCRDPFRGVVCQRRPPGHVDAAIVARDSGDACQSALFRCLAPLGRHESVTQTCRCGHSAADGHCRVHCPVVYVAVAGGTILGPGAGSDTVAGLCRRPHRIHICVPYNRVQGRECGEDMVVRA